MRAYNSHADFQSVSKGIIPLAHFIAVGAFDNDLKIFLHRVMQKKGPTAK